MGNLGGPKNHRRGIGGLMTKQEVLNICETDSHLAWFAHILFAEIIELVDYQELNGCLDEVVAKIVFCKSKDWRQSIINRKIKDAKNGVSTSVADRLDKLEKKVFNENASKTT